MPAKRLYFTPEAKAAAKRVARAKWQASAKGKAARARYEASDTAKARYARYRETAGYRSAQARYRGSEAAKTVMVSYFTEAKRRQPERVKARAAIAIGITRGSIVRPGRCDVCRRESRPDAHHYLGYAPEHWLTVLWLCRPCHKAAHS